MRYPSKITREEFKVLNKNMEMVNMEVSLHILSMMESKLDRIKENIVNIKELTRMEIIK